jgi:hypothetical protein
MMKRLYEEILRTQQAILHELCQVRKDLSRPQVRGFRIRPLIFHAHPQKDNHMAFIALDPGNSPQFTATPTPAGATLPAGLIPTWTSSDPASTVTADSTGLIATLNIDSAATVGEQIVLTISATLPDGTVATGSFTVTVGAAPAADITGFSIVQSA